MNIFNIINISSIIINTKIINITIKSSFFSYYLLTSLLKYFLGIMDLLLLLWICKFLYHWQTYNYFLHCNASLNKISFLPQQNELSTFFLQLVYFLILLLVLFRELICLFFVINMCRRTHVCSKNWHILTKSTAWKWKTWSSIKSNFITGVPILIHISIFSQSNYTN